jgi:nucleotide-binding universal stress UspA family protein
MFRSILVGFDGSPNAWSALRYGLRLAREQGGVVCALWVQEPLPHYASASAEARSREHEAAAYFERLQADAAREAHLLGVRLGTEAVRGQAAQAIVAYARQIGADLIVLGQHGHRGMLDRMLGSTSDRVLDLADCSVLVVPTAPGHDG